MDRQLNNVADVFFSPIRIEVHRDGLLEDSFRKLMPYSHQFKNAVKVSFISEHGVQVSVS